MGTLAEKLQYTLDAINDIQQALIDRGLSVADTDELATYADKIRSIKISDGLLITSDATATAENILKGKTAYARMEKITGTMSNWGSLEITPEVNVIDASTPLPDETPFSYLGGYYGGITVNPKTIKLADYTPGTATAEDIAEGKTAWINGVLVEGTMKEYVIGTATMPQLSANGTGSVNVSYDFGFVPRFISVEEINTTNGNIPFWSIRNVTKNGFTIYFKSVTSGNLASRKLTWIAFP
jgi:hypothetical protein